MKFTRRDWIKLSSVGIATGIAGCSDSADVGPESTSNGQQTTSTYDFGETAVFSSGEEQRLAFTPEEAQLRDLLIYSMTNSIYSESPGTNQTYITIKVTVENRGGESIQVPSGIVFTLDGRQYDTTISSKFQDNSYTRYSEMQPGASRTGWLVFEIQPSDAEGKLVAEFNTFTDSATAEWVIDVGGLERQTYDYTGLSAGESASLAASGKQYSITAVSAEETRSYSYSSGSYQFEQTAGSGNKYILVTVRAENTGDSTVSVPGTYGMSLISGSTQYETGVYRKDDGYEGGEISPGITREGIVQFEVPRATTSYQLQSNLTDHISATWNL